MFNFFYSCALGRQILALSALSGVVLTGCTPREDCVLINAALADGNSRIQEMNEGNLGNVGYNQGIERQVGRIYHDVSQVIEGLQISNQRLQTLQFELAEAYQRASDYRYQAAELIASNPQPDTQIKADIRTLQLDSETNVGTVTDNLRRRCPL